MLGVIVRGGGGENEGIRRREGKVIGQDGGSMVGRRRGRGGGWRIRIEKGDS